MDKKVIEKSDNCSLIKSHFNDDNIYEIGIDEAGRGPLFGAVYTAAVVLPKDNSFDFSKMKDSKKFHSKKKLLETADYIKKNAIAWYVSYESEKTIDDINILQATQKSMHDSIKNVYQILSKSNEFKMNNDKRVHLLVDGNYFKPFACYNESNKQFITLPFNTIEGGDNKYCSIAAASILAKVERDKYIEELCIENPQLIHRYSIDSNKGYGAKKHIDGIKTHGITIWHRRTFGICKNYD
jgi:ribonuclease HII